MTKHIRQGQHRHFPKLNFLAFSGFFFFILWTGFFRPSAVSAVTLNNLTQGQVIQIAPTAGTSMCSDENCSGDGAAAEPYKLMATGMTDSDSAYFIMLDNYCAWRSADCTLAYNGSKTKYWYGTSYNSSSNNGDDDDDDSPNTNDSDLGRGRQSQHILIQLNNFYNSLPSFIGGMTKATAIPSKTFSVAAIDFTYGTGSTIVGACTTTTNVTAYGNIAATFNGSVCTMTSRISFPSYEEWQGGLYAYGRYPTSGSIGYAFCQTRFGTDCANGGSYGLFADSGTVKSPYYPWLRSPNASDASYAWGVGGDGAEDSVASYGALSGLGVLPSLWLSSDLSTVDGSGTYTDPYSLDPCELPENANSLACLPQGAVVQIAPETGTSMCSDQNCSGDGAAAEPYKLMFTGMTDSDSAYFIMLDNYCAWRSADCTYAYNTNSSKSWYGASYNSNYGNTTYSNNLGGGRQSQHILMQLENFYNSLPSTIGGVAKAAAVPSKTFSVAAVTSTAGTGTIGAGGCRTTTNSTAFGNIGATFDSSPACTMTSRVSLPSYEEWQGGFYARGRYPTSGSIGYAFCQTRFGTDCSNGGSYGLFGSTSAKNPYYPWLRSTLMATSDSVWYVNGSNAATSVNTTRAYYLTGVLPSLWLSSDLSPVGGSGTYAEPYVLDPCELPENADKLFCTVPQGSVIQISPEPGTSMCSDKNCSGDGAAAEPYKLMATGTFDGDSTYFVMLDNYCAWRSADCTYAYNTSNTKRWYGTSYNSNYGNTTNNNDLGGGRQSQNILMQLENFYNSLPSTIGGVAKTTAVPSKTFSLAGITSGSTPSVGTCRTTTNATAFGNIAATFDGSACTMSSRVSLPSYEEWQGGLSSYKVYPASGSIGYAFCQTRFGTDCANGGSYGLFADSDTAKSPYYPWLRSPDASSTSAAWNVAGYSATYSVIIDRALSGYGVLPSLWLSSNISPLCGSGTYATPYRVQTIECETAKPVLTLNNGGTAYAKTANATITATDTDSGLSDIRYAWATTATDPTGITASDCSGGTLLKGFTTGQTSAWTSSDLTPAVQGINYLHVCVTDRAGNITKTSEQYNYDTENPICGTTWSPAAPVTWKTAAATQLFTLTDSADAASGMTATSYTCTAGATNGATCTTTIYDNAGNTNICTSPANRIDTALPTLTLKNAKADTWYNITRTATIEFQDTLSGISTLRYAWNTSTNISASVCTGGTAIPVTSGQTTLFTSTTLTPPAAGNNTLYVCGTDMAGNIQYATGNYKYESTAPTCTTWTPANGSVPWQTASTGTAFTLSGCSDTDGAGLLSSNTYTCTTGTYHADTCTVTVKDNAGNQTVYTSPTNRVDMLKPTISASGASAIWGNAQKSATVTYADPAASSGSGQSGILRAQYSWNTNNLGAACDGGVAVGASGSTIQTPETAGAYTLYLCVVDNAGNVTANQGQYNWENAAPTVTQTPNVAVPESGIYTESPTITISGSDGGGSNLKGVRFRWDSTFNATDTTPAWQANNTTTTIPSYGYHTLYYQVSDNAGNYSVVQSADYALDTEEPTLETGFTNEGIEGNNSWYTAAPVLRITGHDYIGGSPDDTRVDKIVTDLLTGEYDSAYGDSTSATNIINQPSGSAATATFRSSDPTPRFTDLTIPANGIYTAYYYATNETPIYSAIGSTTFKTDSQAPTAYLTGLNQSADRNQITLSYSMTDDYHIEGTGLNLLSGMTSGLAACDLQEAVAVYDADGNLGAYSDFSTILSDCGTNEATNSANSTITSQTLNRDLESGRTYRYQLNLLDNAGNSSQVNLSAGVVSNHPPRLNIFNLNQNQSAYPNTSISITGTVTDEDMGETVTVSADMGGIIKTQPLTTPITNQGFTLTWLGEEIPQGVYGVSDDENSPSLGAIAILAADGTNETAVTYQGQVTSRSTNTETISNGDITDLYNSTSTKQAGAVFFLAGTTPNIKDHATGELTETNPEANGYYCYSDTGCFKLTPSGSHQIWYKDITHADTNTTSTYPFIIQFYDQPTIREELRINDTEF